MCDLWFNTLKSNHIRLSLLIDDTRLVWLDDGTRSPESVGFTFVLVSRLQTLQERKQSQLVTIKGEVQLIGFPIFVRMNAYGKPRSSSSATRNRSTVCYVTWCYLKHGGRSPKWRVIFCILQPLSPCVESKYTQHECRWHLIILHCTNLSQVPLSLSSLSGIKENPCGSHCYAHKHMATAVFRYASEQALVCPCGENQPSTGSVRPGTSAQSSLMWLY